MEAHSGIKPESIEKVAKVLIGILADEFILYVQIRKAQWSVEGHVLYLYKLLEDQYRRIGVVIDDVAEQIRSIGHHVPTTFHLQPAQLTEQSNLVNDERDLLKDLLESHESIIMNLRKHIYIIDQKLNQVGTSDFITRVMMTHEKLVWILLSHLTE